FELAHATSINALPSNPPLEPHTGLIAVMKRAVTLKLRGDALIGTVALVAGLNLVGLPLQDTALSRLSELAQIEGLSGNVNRILSYDEQQFNAFRPGIDRVGSAADIPISGGHAYVIEVNAPTTLLLDGRGWDNVR
ncbi:MAG: hypothetical protein O7E52_27905, partial [Candidatus Poribacteria bacterium]|nr:hypothetical protein [Candidatus Poribacteria bacterium]